MKRWLAFVPILGCILGRPAGLGAENPDAAIANEYPAPPVLTGNGIAKLIEDDDAAGLKRMLDLGLDPDSIIPCWNGASKASLLEYACILGAENALKTLIQSGAKKNLQSTLGRLPIECLLQSGHEKLAPLLQMEEPKLTEAATFELLVSQRLKHSSYGGPDKPKKPVYVGINHQEISKDLITLLESTGLHYAAADASRKSLDAFYAIQFKFDYPDPLDKKRIRMHEESGGFLSGGIWEAVYVCRYGYWLPQDERSFDK